MIEPDDLQDFAIRVLYDFREFGSEADLRRAISACYYTVFHSICRAGAKTFVGPDVLLAQIERSYDHAAIAAAAREVERKFRSSKATSPGSQLATLAQTFLRLQEQRVHADYDLRRSMSLDDLDELIDEMHRALNALVTLRGDPGLAEFLLHPLLQRRKPRG